MLPSRVKKATKTYGAPRGHGDEIGVLPYWEDTDTLGGWPYKVIRSAWKPTAEELACLNAGAYIILGVHTGDRPLYPVDMNIDYLDEEVVASTNEAT